MKLYLKLSISSLLIGLVSLMSWGFAVNCKDVSLKNSVTDGSRSSHPYTCEANTTARKTYLQNLCQKDGSVSTPYSAYTCSAGFICHRCVCPSGTTWDTSTNKCKSDTPALSCDANKGLIASSDGKSCICDTSKYNDDGKGGCVAKGNGIVCNSGYTVNAAKTDCECLGTILADKSCSTTTTPAPANTDTKPKELSAEEQCEKEIADGADKKWDGKQCVSCREDGVCCGIELNTNVPFVGKCIRLGNDSSSQDTNVTTETNAFPRLMGGLIKILTTIILLVSFGGIIAGGVLIASSGGDTGNAKKGKELIKNIIIAIAVLGASGIILHLINPNFF